MSNAAMTVRIWGARGSIPCPGPDTVRYGGNTSCVEIACGEYTLIFDAGSGLRMLANELTKKNSIVDFDLFLSHCHIDHLIGLPFFIPALEKDSRLKVWAGNTRPAGGVKEAVRKLMSYPLFPIEIEMARAKIEFADFDPGDIVSPRSGIQIKTAALNHPGGATGYRVEYGGRIIAFVTDMEWASDKADAAALALCRHADLLIIDATYTDGELKDHVGWGHSSWQQAIRLADAAHVKRVCLYHHDPEHDDATMDSIAELSDEAWPGTIVAREGMTIEV